MSSFVQTRKVSAAKRPAAAGVSVVVVWVKWIPKRWYRGTWFDSFRCVGANTAPSPWGPVHWHAAGELLLVYQYDDDKKDLSLWEVWRLPRLAAVEGIERSVRIMGFLSKKPAGQAGMPVRVLSDKEAVKRWPCLWEYLTSDVYEESTQTRKLSTVSLFLGSQGLTACLNDRDNARSCFASATSLLGALDALEGMARSEDTVWREDKAQTGSSARKK